MDNWAQCMRCDKWRRLKATTNPAQLPDEWDCTMPPFHKPCATAEECATTESPAPRPKQPAKRNSPISKNPTTKSGGSSPQKKKRAEPGPAEVGSPSTRGKAAVVELDTSTPVGALLQEPQPQPANSCLALILICGNQACKSLKPQLVQLMGAKNVNPTSIAQGCSGTHVAEETHSVFHFPSLHTTYSELVSISLISLTWLQALKGCDRNGKQPPSLVHAAHHLLKWYSKAAPREARWREPHCGSS
jgi:hypothetical protein